MAERQHLENRAIAERLDSFATLLELAGANPYSARAYRRAAELIRSTEAPVADLIRAGRARELRGIGRGIEQRLVELVETGELAELEDLERRVSPDLVGLGLYLGIGARRAVHIAETLGIRTASEFREAAAAGRLKEVPGIGPATEQKLLAGLAREEEPRPPRGMLLHRARRLLAEIAGPLAGTPAGDPRRYKDSSERLAVVAAADDPEPVLNAFASLPQIVSVLERWERRAYGVTVDGAPVELVVAAPDRFGTELLRATGSPEYVAALEPLPDAPDEEGVYRGLGIPFCPPELREAPFQGETPPLVELAQIRGDLHAHTTWSDGAATVEEMALGAIARGYEYLAICDHTPAVGAVRGLNADDLRRQAVEIADVDEALAPFRVLRGTECDILPDGQLDLPDSILAELDWVQASVHGGQRLPRGEQTKRVEEALRNPYVSCLSHPKGRYINRRAENELDVDRLIEVAIEEGVALEVNGLPDRLDLRDVYVRQAVEGGATIVCSTDAHSVRGLGNMELAVATARRGWAPPSAVVNTRPLDSVLRGRRSLRR
ncbi:MAG: helix-hairpin-helix domain-containing protein [Verrucomicrobiota bacterium]